jgi:hypothetical protein
MTNPNEHEDEGPVPGLSGLRLDREPERDLWPGIAARLPARRPVWIARVSYAAAAVLVMGVSMHLLFNVAPQRGGPVATPLAAATVAMAPARAPLHVQNGNRALVQANLKIVDDAEKQLEQALRHAPDSEPLKRLLDATREQRRGLRQLLARPV